MNPQFSNQPVSFSMMISEAAYRVVAGVDDLARMGRKLIAQKS